MRDVKIYNRNATSFFEILNGEVKTIKEANYDTIKLNEISIDDMIPGALYMSNKGHTVKYLGGSAFDYVERSPLRLEFSVQDLNERCLRLFWILKNNCKNGTCDGV